jgi:cyclin-dependent kinase 6
MRVHGTYHRLLDICHGQRLEREMVLYLVFEHVDQDLNSFIEKCPSPGLGPDRIKAGAVHHKPQFT